MDVTNNVVLLSRKYDELYGRACELIEKYNPCEIIDSTCKAKRLRRKLSSFCCDGCDHLTYNGCSIKSIYCKLWTCSNIETTLSIEFKNEQYLLFNEAFKSGLLVLRSDKDETIRFHLYALEKNNPFAWFAGQINMTSNLYVDDNKVVRCGKY